MTATEMARLIGQRGWINGAQPGLAMSVEVRDVRISFGRIQFLVTPLDGIGSAWIEAATMRRVADTGEREST